MKRKLKVRTYTVVREAVEGAILPGLYKALKHSDERVSEPLLQAMQEQVSLYVMNALCEVIDFDS